MMIHLGIQGSFRERLFEAVKKAGRTKARLRIGPSQQLVQDGIRNMRLFASRHGWAPFHPSCPPKHEIPDSLRRVSEKLAAVAAEEAAKHPHKPVEVWATDEHRIGLKPIIRRVWAPKGQRPIALGHHRYK